MPANDNARLCPIPGCTFAPVQGGAWCRDHHPRRCTAIRVDGERCRTLAAPGSNSRRCHRHPELADS